MNPIEANILLGKTIHIEKKLCQKFRTDSYSTSERHITHKNLYGLCKCLIIFHNFKNFNDDIKSKMCIYCCKDFGNNFLLARDTFVSNEFARICVIHTHLPIRTLVIVGYSLEI